MRKLKWLFMICLMVVLIGVGRTDVRAEDPITEDGFEYITDNSGEVKIINYHGSAENIIIPAEIGGRKVTAVDLGDNENRDTIKHVTISEGIETLVGGLSIITIILKLLFYQIHCITLAFMLFLDVAN